jgi:hypothetical protein
MTADTYPEGGDRKTSSLSVFFDSGLLKLSMNDRDVNKSLYVTADGLLDALDSMEAALRDGSAVWRKNSWQNGKK